MPNNSPSKRRKPTTLKEVASAAGVSLMTVSNFVNGQHQQMSAEVRDRVGEAVKRLNYRKNNVARNLRISELLSVGMIIVDNSPSYLADGYTTQIVSGVSNHLTENGYSLILQGIRPAEFESSFLIQRLQTDGLFAMLSGDEASRKSQFELLKSIQQPLVLYLERFDGGGDLVCSLRQSEFAAGKRMGEHVLPNNPTKAVILTPELNIWSAVLEREQGIRSVLEPGLGTENVQTHYCGDGGFDDVWTAILSSFTRQTLPDVFHCINDQIAIAAIDAIKSLGAVVPGDVEVTGFNAFDIHRYSDPNITTIRSHAYDMGIRGAQEMLKRLTTGEFSEKDIVFPFEFIQGGSTRKNKIHLPDKRGLTKEGL